VGPRPFPNGSPVAVRLEYYSIPEPNSGCLLWTGAVTKKGYGRDPVSRKPVAAHRLAWIEAHGAIPATLHVLHKCDVRSCINPAHLFLGTNLDNIRDREQKRRGRMPSQKGAANSNAILCEQDVREILADGRHYKIVAAAYGVSPATIGSIRAGHAWKWVERKAP
jgi:hypothetical protein